MPRRWTSPTTQKPDADGGCGTGRPEPAVQRHAGMGRKRGPKLSVRLVLMSVAPRPNQPTKPLLWPDPPHSLAQIGRVLACVGYSQRPSRSKRPDTVSYTHLTLPTN